MAIYPCSGNSRFGSIGNQTPAFHRKILCSGTLSNDRRFAVVDKPPLCVLALGYFVDTDDCSSSYVNYPDDYPQNSFLAFATASVAKCCHSLHHLLLVLGGLTTSANSMAQRMEWKPVELNDDRFLASFDTLITAANQSKCNISKG